MCNKECQIYWCPQVAGRAEGDFSTRQRDRLNIVIIIVVIIVVVVIIIISRQRDMLNIVIIIVVIIIIIITRHMLNTGCSAKKHNSLKCLCQGSQDSSGPPRVKSKLDVEDDELGVDAMAHFCSPQRSFREKITDFFTAYDDANADREGSVSPPMPVLTPQVLRKKQSSLIPRLTFLHTGGKPSRDGRFVPGRAHHSSPTDDSGAAPGTQALHP